jgi:predicted secreted Zn-dependent protease
MSDLSSAFWRKSTYSMGGGDCVQTAQLPTGEVAVRHSKAPDKGVLVFTTSEWRAFIAGVKDCEFDYGA